MGRFTWVTKDLTDDALIFTNSQIAGAPVTNLFDDQPKRIWQTQGAFSGINIDVDFGADATFDTVALLYHNGTDTGRILISIGDTQGELGLVTEADIPMWASAGLGRIRRPHALHIAETPYTSRWLRLRVNDNDSTDFFIRAGILMVGLSQQFSRNFTRGGAITPMRRVRDVESLEGSQFPALYSSSLRANLRFEYMDPNDYHEEWALVEAYSGQPMLFILDPDDPSPYHQMLYGDMRPEGTVEKPYYSRYSFNFELIEWA